MISIKHRRIIVKVTLWAAVGALLGLVAERFLLLHGAGNGLETATPAWVKVAILIGLASAAVLTIMFVTEKGRRAPEGGTAPEDRVPASKGTRFNPFTVQRLSPDSLAAPRRYSFVAMAAAAIVVAVLPQDALFGNAAKRTPVTGTRTLEGLAVSRAGAVEYVLKAREPGEPMPAGSSLVSLMLIDGNRNNQLVPFPHDDHLDYLGEEDACSSCHHQNMPFDKNTSCVECHRDMFQESDTFSHTSHVEKLGGNAACVACHEQPGATKTRDTTTACATCHQDMVVEDSLVEQPEGGLKGYAVSYKDAMHGLCVGCHFESEEPDCAFCHRDSLSSQLRKQGPYAAGRP